MAMEDRTYYSARKARNPLKPKLDLTTLTYMFGELYKYLSGKGYFNQVLGFQCFDGVYQEYKYEPGVLGSEQMVAAHLALRLNKDGLWPIEEAYVNYSEDDVFDVIEFLYDSVSKPLHCSYAHSDCAHYDKFDKTVGKQEFRSRINSILSHYGNGYELAENGEILSFPEHGLEPLLIEDSPESEHKDVQAKIDGAINKFRRRSGTPVDKRDAVRTLADIFEFLRDDAKKALARKDEGDLFTIANNFAIRHHNDQQKGDYDEAIWLDWMFYFYLSTLQAMLKTLKNHQKR